MAKLFSWRRRQWEDESVLLTQVLVSAGIRYEAEPSMISRRPSSWEQLKRAKTETETCIPTRTAGSR